MTEARNKPLASGPDRLVRLSLSLRNFVDFVGKWGSFFVVPLILVTIWDVLWRKVRNPLGEYLMYLNDNVGPWFGDVWLWLRDVLFQSVPFQSTLLQELEWHFHTALFTLLLGYAYVNNAHVRVDLIREKLVFRKQAWIEFLGCTLFMIPYCVVVLYFAWAFTLESFRLGEISASLVGLPHRWIIKSVLVAGLMFALLAGVAVWIQTVLVLFGPKDLTFHLMTLERPGERTEKGFEIAGVDDLEASGASGDESQATGPVDEERQAAGT